MTTKLVPQFVECIPSELQDGVLYVSMECSTVVHRCCCGCGRKVVTPLSPQHGWQLNFDGDTITLDPSIGNWQYPCRSHYWIRNNRPVWIPDTRGAAQVSRNTRPHAASSATKLPAAQPLRENGRGSLWHWLRQKWRR